MTQLLGILPVMNEVDIAPICGWLISHVGQLSLLHLYYRGSNRGALWPFIRGYFMHI